MTVIDLAAPDRVVTDRTPHNVIAHHWRTPMTAVIGYLETIERHWDRLSDDHKREFVAKAVVRAWELNGWIEDVLTAMEPA